jgi:hypothetical protein
MSNTFSNVSCLVTLGGVSVTATNGVLIAFAFGMLLRNLRFASLRMRSAAECNATVVFGIGLTITCFVVSCLSKLKVEGIYELISKRASGVLY